MQNTIFHAFAASALIAYGAAIKIQDHGYDDVEDIITDTIPVDTDIPFIADIVDSNIAPVGMELA